MTLHEAIEQILFEYTEGLTFEEIAHELNRIKLYQKKDLSSIEPGQVKLRIRNYAHLFVVENNKVTARKNFRTNKMIFDHSVFDAIASTSKDSISNKIIALPFIVFIKRIVEAQTKEYNIHFSVYDFDIFSSFDNYSNEEELHNDLFHFINSICDQNFELEPIRKAAINILENIRPGLFFDIYSALRKYSFDSEHFSNKEFGFFFNDLIYRITNSATHIERNTSPVDINTLLSSLYESESKTILDPFAGTAGTLISVFNKKPIHVIGYEKSTENWLLGKLNLFLNGVDSFDFHNSDCLKLTGLFAKKSELIITDLPFKSSFKKDELSEISWTTSKDPSTVFIHYIIDTLEENGKALALVPSNFLFNSSTTAKDMREMLIENDWLDAIITLPQGVFLPYSSLTSAILCIDLNKTTKDTIYFIDASEVDLSKTERKQQCISDDQIDEIVSLFKRRPVKYESPLKIRGAAIPIENVRNQNYDFNSRRYLYQLSEHIQSELFNEEEYSETVMLGDILFEYKRGERPVKMENLKLIKGRELRSSPIEFALTTKDIKESVHENLRNFTVIDSNALLLLTHFNTLKPTYFIYQNEPVLISNNIKAFKINEEKVNIEYLISQLHATYFLRQLDFIRKGSSQSFISSKDLLRLQIKLPPTLQEQKSKLATLQSDSLKSQVTELTSALEKQKTESISEQISIISSIQHELGNKLPSLKNTVSDLKGFFVKEAKRNPSLSLESKIRTIIPGENEGEVDTLSDIFERIERILNYTISMVDDAGGIIKSDPSKFKPAKTNLVEFLESEVSAFKSIHGSLSNIRFEFPKEENVFLNIDKKQFSVALNNLLQNAIRHGFTEADHEYCFIFQIVPDDKDLILIAKNDGNPFPNGFTMEKYKQPYLFAGKSGNSGLGGYIINRVIENHGGTMRLLPDIDKADSFKVQFEIKFPKKYL